MQENAFDNIQGYWAALLPLIVEKGLDLLGAILIFIAGWIVSSWAANKVRNQVERHQNLDTSLAKLTGKVARLAVLIVTTLLVLGQFGVQTASLVALLGAAGLAIGLALQGALSNVAAGVSLLVLQPFRSGDFVEFSGTMGTVDEIGLFMTKMTTFDGIALAVPNGHLWGNVIKNYSRNDVRRIDLVIGISYADDMDKALGLVHQVLQEEPRILSEPEPLVAVGELAESSVNLLVRPWVKRTDFWFTKLDLTKKIKERFDAEGVSIPFPQRDVHLFQPPDRGAA